MGPKWLPCDTDIGHYSSHADLLLLYGTNMGSICVLRGTTVPLSKHNIKKSKFPNAKNNDNDIL